MNRTTSSSLNLRTAKVGNLYGYHNGGMAGDVFRITGVMPCIRSTTGGNQQPFILIEK